MSKITINSHVDVVKKELEDRSQIVLEALGLQAQGNAITEISRMVYDTPQSPTYKRTGRLRNSITYVTAKSQGTPNTQPGQRAEPSDYAPNGTPDADKVYIGTNVEYAPYIELGARSMPPRPFLKNAITGYKEEYKDIIKKGLS